MTRSSSTTRETPRILQELPNISSFPASFPAFRQDHLLGPSDIPLFSCPLPACLAYLWSWPRVAKTGSLPQLITMSRDRGRDSRLLRWGHSDTFTFHLLFHSSALRIDSPTSRTAANSRVSAGGHLDKGGNTPNKKTRQKVFF